MEKETRRGWDDGGQGHTAGRATPFCPRGGRGTLV